MPEHGMVLLRLEHLMSLRIDDLWQFNNDTATREKRFYRDEQLIGRVRRWHMLEPRGRLTFWFAAEQWQSRGFHQIGELHGTFEEAFVHLISLPWVTRHPLDEPPQPAPRL